MTTKELVFDLFEVKDLRLGFVCPKCGTETVCALGDVIPSHQCYKDNDSYPDVNGRRILQAFHTTLSDLRQLNPPVRLRLTIPRRPPAARAGSSVECSPGGVGSAKGL